MYRRHTLFVSRTPESESESAQEVIIVQIDFSVAFDRVNHMGILYKFYSLGIVGSMMCIDGVSIKSITMVYSCLSKLFNVVSGVPQGGVLGPLLIAPNVHLLAVFHSGE